MECVKIEPKEHIAVCMENRDLSRGEVKINVNEDLLEQLVSNYIIVKSILKHLQWQDQFLCKFVCKMWYSAVNALQREMLQPQDFVLAAQGKTDTMVLRKSGTISSEPLAVMAFANSIGFCHIMPCSEMIPSPCTPACENSHWGLDYIDQELAYPKDCMLTVQASNISYMPLASAATAAYTYKSASMCRSKPQICGTVVPKIPNVNYYVINLKGTDDNDLKENFYDVVDKMAETEVIKGVLVYVTDKFVTSARHDYVEDIIFLKHFNKVQPNIPFALGGCIIEDVVSQRSELLQFQNAFMNESQPPFFSDNVLSLVIFTVPKDESGNPVNKSNFEMYSFILESYDYSKQKIENSVKEFSDMVPRFEHSLVFKLSCVGRDQKYKFEQDTFRSFFPDTPLIGCYGNGELGHNHPARTQPPSPANFKRAKKNTPLNEILYSYSTVFVYCGWGKNVT